MLDFNQSASKKNKIKLEHSCKIINWQNNLKYIVKNGLGIVVP